MTEVAPWQNPMHKATSA